MDLSEFHNTVCGPAHKAPGFCVASQSDSAHEKAVRPSWRSKKGHLATGTLSLHGVFLCAAHRSL